MTQHIDVLIIGAGLSGIGMACHLKRQKTGRDFLLLERRHAIGGTWDLFRYPGVRSDSDMFTFGYNFRPWTSTRVLADGPSIRRYIEDAAAEYNVDERIQFGRQVIRAEWCSTNNRWTVTAVNTSTGESETYSCNFLIAATGYYDYDHGHRPRFPGEDRFRGQLLHPQFWPEDLDYTDKRVVVIGSGATAITLVPAMSSRAAHVTMLQRSPTYIAAIPAVDKITVSLQRLGLPEWLVYTVGRVRNVAFYRLVFEASRVSPMLVRKLLLSLVRKQVGASVDMQHFSPSYAPWDQRLCVVPDGDLFTVLRSGQASIITDHIDTFTETGIRLQSGRELDADIVITATGLSMQMLGGAELVVDGETQQMRDLVTYKGAMLGNIPNAAIIVGYTNASWTLRADLSAEWICRLLNHMRDRCHAKVVPVSTSADRSDKSILGWALTAGYIQRGDDAMPRQGTHGPWKLVSNYYRDWLMVRHTGLVDASLRFSGSDRVDDRLMEAGGVHR